MIDCNIVRLALGKDLRSLRFGKSDFFEYCALRAALGPGKGVTTLVEQISLLLLREIPRMDVRFLSVES